VKNVLLLCGAVAIAAVAAVTAKTDPPAKLYEPVAKAEASQHAPPTAPASPSAETSLAGEVREVIDVAQYTYLRLATADRGELWAAVSKAPVSVGSQVSIVDAARMTSFESVTLKRTFDVIYFGNLGSAARSSAPTGALPPGHPPLDAQHGAEVAHGAVAAHGAEVAHGASAPPTAAIPSGVKVAPATGQNAYTIAALFAQRASLEGKRARVRGQIIKATPVQGITYYRISDGSSEEPSSAQLVVSSTTAQSSPGQVVTFDGQVRTNADVGIGIKYPVMLQDARLAE
jgi:hypothetical protein